MQLEIVVSWLSRSLMNFWVVGKMEMHGERRIRRSQAVEKFCVGLDFTEYRRHVESLTPRDRDLLPFCHRFLHYPMMQTYHKDLSNDVSKSKSLQRSCKSKIVLTSRSYISTRVKTRNLIDFKTLLRKRDHLSQARMIVYCFQKSSLLHTIFRYNFSHFGAK